MGVVEEREEAARDAVWADLQRGRWNISRIGCRQIASITKSPATLADYSNGETLL